MSGEELCLNSLYRFSEAGESGGRIVGGLESSGNPLLHTDKLRMAGFTTWPLQEAGGE